MEHTGLIINVGDVIHGNVHDVDKIIGDKVATRLGNMEICQQAVKASPVQDIDAADGDHGIVINPRCV